MRHASSFVRLILLLVMLLVSACVPSVKKPVVPAKEILDLTEVHSQEINGNATLTYSPACRSQGTLDVGMDATYPPMESMDDATGKIKGFDVDLLNAIFKDTPITLHYHNAKFGTIFQGLQSGRYDLVHDALTITPERAKTIAFANPYFVGGQVLVIRHADLGVINQIGDLASRTVGAETGTTSLDIAKSIGAASVKQFQSIQQGLDAVAAKTTDGMVVDQIVATSLVRQNASLDLAIMPNARLSVEYYAIAMRHDCSELRTLINQRQAAIMADGSYRALYMSYFGDEPPAMFKPDGQPMTFQEALVPAVNRSNQ